MRPRGRASSERHGAPCRKTSRRGCLAGVAGKDRRRRLLCEDNSRTGGICSRRRRASPVPFSPAAKTPRSGIRRRFKPGHPPMGCPDPMARDGGMCGPEEVFQPRFMSSINPVSTWAWAARSDTARAASSMARAVSPAMALTWVMDWLISSEEADCCSLAVAMART